MPKCRGSTRLLIRLSIKQTDNAFTIGGRHKLSQHIDIDLKQDHISGNFSWERKPDCSCGNFIQAIEQKFIFVSNMTDGEGEKR